MSELHPNDIGLATFEDVGDVSLLRTTAKTVVQAINEVYETGGSAQRIFGTQLYVDGNNNLIVGENNAVHGHNNLIIGSDNTIVGDNHTIMQNERAIFESSLLGVVDYDVAKKQILCMTPERLKGTPAVSAGDKIVIQLQEAWNTTSGSDRLFVDLPRMLTTVTKVEETDDGSLYITLENHNLSEDVPDNVHTVLESVYCPLCAVLNDNFKRSVAELGSVNMGLSAPGKKAAALNNGTASGSYSLGTNTSTASGYASASLNCSKSTKNYAFAANYGQCEGDSSAAFNYSYCYNPYTFTSGYYSRAYGRTLICVSLDTVSKKLTIATGQSTTGLVGKRIAIRCYNNANPVIFRLATIKSISSTVLTLGDVSFYSGTYAEKLLPGNHAFVIDNASNYGQGNFVGGYYSVAAGKYSFSHGLQTIAAHEGAAIFGKYGFTDSEYGLFLANGTSTQAPGLAFKAESDGSVHADGTYTSPCADYAEFFEWEDQNAEDEDRVGYFVKLVGDKITFCEDFDVPLGVVSANPAIIGDSGKLHWHEKYVTDDFSRVQYHRVVVPEEVDAKGNVLVAEHVEMQPILNPDWDASKVYVPREDRPEWATVGVLGKLVVYDDGTLLPGNKCRPGSGGIAVKSEKTGYPVLKRVSDDKVLIWMK